MAEHQWLTSVVQNLETERFFGVLSLRFRDGVLVLIEKTETIQPPKQT